MLDKWVGNLTKQQDLVYSNPMGTVETSVFREHGVSVLIFWGGLPWVPPGLCLSALFAPHFPPSDKCCPVYESVIILGPLCFGVDGHLGVYTLVLVWKDCMLEHNTIFSSLRRGLTSLP